MNRAYFARRFAMALLAIGVAVVLNFLLIHLMPGDPASRFYADPRVPLEVKQEIIELFGLDKPLWTQFLLYLRNVFRGELGVSFTTQRPVLQVIAERIPWTLAITLIPTLATIACGILDRDVGRMEAGRDRGFLSQDLGHHRLLHPLLLVGDAVGDDLHLLGPDLSLDGDGEARAFFG